MKYYVLYGSKNPEENSVTMKEEDWKKQLEVSTLGPEQLCVWLVSGSFYNAELKEQDLPLIQQTAAL